MHIFMYSLFQSGMRYYWRHLLENTTTSRAPAIFTRKDSHLSVPTLYISKQILSYCLQWIFLPDRETRSKLNLPKRTAVDFRAACFCHRQLIDVGYVCSVCLSSKISRTNSRNSLDKKYYYISLSFTQYSAVLVRSVQLASKFGATINFNSTFVV